MIMNDETKNYISKLINILQKKNNKSSEMLDIIDVLTQVYLKIDTTKNPEALINRLVHYIRSVAIKGRIYFPPEEEDLIIKLGAIGQKAGLNGLYMADFSDKSQFYSYFDKNKMIRR
ncbi:bacteriocin immunity protein [Vagococcus fluvialis]|uniref:bacteriocin immunity protein n=1 Tax=Vagococcus fluvialis TaxID=2738 RepID=UPI0015732FC7|nr:bacteriocin immunity protein [Enterococcus faecalis]UDM78494.1 bacteriocin immunity protein [Vagococcus fluvialis]UDM84109.1 bacteriocin immunity protein [Vagococcus fluvialis]